MCAILVRYCDIFGIELEESGLDSEDTALFADHKSISAYAKEFVYIAKNSGFVSGKNGNLFDPKAGATRAEAAAVFMRFMIYAGL